MNETWMAYLALALVLFVFRKTNWGQIIYGSLVGIVAISAFFFGLALCFSVFEFVIYLAKGDWSFFYESIHTIFFTTSVAVVMLSPVVFGVSVLALPESREFYKVKASHSKKKSPKKGNFFRDAFRKLINAPVRYRDVYTGLCAYCGAGKQHDGQCSNCGAGWKEEVYREPEGI